MVAGWIRRVERTAGPGIFFRRAGGIYVCRPFDAAAGMVAYRWVQRFTAGCSRLWLGAAVYGWSAAAYGWVRRFTAGCSRLRPSAAVYRWVRRFTARCSRLWLECGGLRLVFPAASSPRASGHQTSGDILRPVTSRVSAQTGGSTNNTWRHSETPVKTAHCPWRHRHGPLSPRPNRAGQRGVGALTPVPWTPATISNCTGKARLKAVRAVSSPICHAGQVGAVHSRCKRPAGSWITIERSRCGPSVWVQARPPSGFWDWFCCVYVPPVKHITSGAITGFTQLRHSLLYFYCTNFTQEMQRWFCTKTFWVHQMVFILPADGCALILQPHLFRPRSGGGWAFRTRGRGSRSAR